MKTTLSHLVIIGLMSFFSFFVNNTVLYTDIMECRNIVTAREMVSEGNYMVPTMNGDLRLEKPPLPTWIIALVENVSPNNLALQRAMSGLAAFMLLLFLYFFAIDITGKPKFALISCIVLCTSYSIILLGRTASWDIYCHAFMMGCIFYLHRAFIRKGRNYLLFCVAGIFAGMSFLSKGPVSFYALFLPFLISFFVIYHPKMNEKWMEILNFLFFTILVGGFWYVYLYVFHYTELSSVLNKESGAWLNHSVRPWYYYWKFFLESGIWSLVFLTSLIFPIWKTRLETFKPYMFALLWLVLQLVLLSLLPEKKSRYLLPILLPAAYIISSIFDYWSKSLKSKVDRLSVALYRVNGYLLSIVALLISLAVIFYRQKLGFDIDTFVLIICFSIIFATFFFVSTLKRKSDFLLVGVLFMFLFAECFLMPSIVSVFNNNKFKGISLLKNNEKLLNIPYFYEKGEEMRIEIVYDAGKKVLPIDLSLTSDVLSNLPFVILVHGDIDRNLIPSSVKVEDLGVYDNNRRQEKSGFYNDKFIYHAYLLEK